MPLVMRPHTPELSPLVGAFNARLRAHGVRYQFPESPRPRWLPPEPGRRIYQEHFLAADDTAVHGGYILKHQPFLVNGEEIVIGNYQLPLSEGLTDRRYAAVGLQLLLDCVRRQPLLYSLGIGGHGESLTKLLQAAGWSLWDVPFYFKVMRPRAFLRNLRYARGTRLRRLALDVAALSGLGAVALLAQEAAGAWARGGRRRPTARSEAAAEFGGWADDVWRRGRGTCRLCAVRDRDALEILYPASDPRFHRLRVGDRGWCVCLDTPMRAHRFFGDMRVGTLVDCFAVPRGEPEVVAAALDHLRAGGADVIVSNQSHRGWGRALTEAGFLRGPSNFIFAAAPALAARLQPFAATCETVHLTRGDGDGPINL